MKYVYTNESEGYQYPLGRALPPGQSIELDTDTCPELAPAGLLDAAKNVTAPAVNEDPNAHVVALQHKKIDEIKASLATLTDDQLDLLGELEQAAVKPRQGVLGAIAETKLNRAGSPT